MRRAPALAGLGADPHAAVHDANIRISRVRWISARSRAGAPCRGQQPGRCGRLTAGLLDQRLGAAHHAGDDAVHAERVEAVEPHGCGRGARDRSVRGEASRIGGGEIEAGGRHALGQREVRAVRQRREPERRARWPDRVGGPQELAALRPGGGAQRGGWHPGRLLGVELEQGGLVAREPGRAARGGGGEGGLRGAAQQAVEEPLQPGVVRDVAELHRLLEPPEWAWPPRGAGRRRGSRRSEAVGMRRLEQEVALGERQLGDGRLLHHVPVDRHRERVGVDLDLGGARR